MTAVVKPTTIRTISTLGAEVELRAAVLGLQIGEVAERMGIAAQSLSALFTHASITERMFLQLSAALEMAPEDWGRALPRSRTPLEKVRAMRRAVHRQRTEKTKGSKNGGGEPGGVC